MNRVSCYLVGLTVLGGGIAWAQEKKAGDLTDPTEILKKADEATKATKFVRYHATGKREGRPSTASAEGDVILEGLRNNRPAKFRFDVKTQRPSSGEPMEYRAGSDGEQYYVIDDKAKKAYIDIDPAVMGSYAGATQLLTMLEFVHNTPFSDEINAKTKELKGARKVGDEECYEVHVEYSQSNQKAEWCFSKKDFLPRAVKRIFPGPEGQPAGSVELVITKLEVKPKFDKDPYKFELPEGFEKIEDFAP